MQGVTSENTGEKRESAGKEENAGMTGIAETPEIREFMEIAETVRDTANTGTTRPLAFFQWGPE
jgi:hypothetical protein